MSCTTIVAYWALPHQQDALAYQQVIDALAEAQGGARFTPHISLGSLGAFDADVDDVVSALRGLTVRPTQLGRSAVFTKSLYVDLAQSAQLELARASLAGRNGFRSTRSFAPHISLCYGPPVNEDAVKPLIDALLTKPIRIDRLQAMEISLPAETYADVSAWAPIATFQI